MESKKHACDFLISDEIEALVGYEKKLPLFNKKEQEQIRKIMADEADHIMILKNISEGKYEWDHYIILR